MSRGEYCLSCALGVALELHCCVSRRCWRRNLSCRWVLDEKVVRVGLDCHEETLPWRVCHPFACLRGVSPETGMQAGSKRACRLVTPISSNASRRWMGIARRCRWGGCCVVAGEDPEVWLGTQRCRWGRSSSVDGDEAAVSVDGGECSDSRVNAAAAPTWSRL